MVDNSRFIADVERFARLSADKMLRVARQSTQDVIREAQRTTAEGGNMPVDVGTLRNSLVTEVRGREVGQGEDSYTLGISTLQLGDPFQVSWTVNYAIPRHYMVNANGGLWRDRATQQWTRIVAENVRRVQ